MSQVKLVPMFSPKGVELNILSIDGEPWFAISDIEKLFNVSNLRQNLKNLATHERRSMKAEHGGTKTYVSESGMWLLVLRSKEAINEGTPAYQARVWVTSEVLPSIRKTGSYTVPSKTIDATQQYLVRTAVNRLAKNHSWAYQRVYHALYEHFKVPRYQELKKTDFVAVMKFLKATDLLEELEDSPTPPPQAEGFVLSKEEMKLIQNAVYLQGYLFRPIGEAFYNFLTTAKSPLAPRAWECFNDLNLSLLEGFLDKHGYSVKGMPQYKNLTLNR